MALAFSNGKQDSHDEASITITDPETGEIICSNCGVVLSERMESHGREWRFFTDKSDMPRTGPDFSLAIHDMGLSTTIGRTNKDASGSTLSIPMKSAMKRLRVWDLRCPTNRSKKSLSRALNQLIILKDKLGLSDAVVEKAAYIYRKAKAKDLVRGRMVLPIMASSVYAACRITETPRTLSDISLAADIKRTHLASCYRLLVNNLELNVPVTDPVHCVSRISSQVNCSEKISRNAINLIRKLEQIGFSAGKNPAGLAAACLYVSCEKMCESHSQKEIAQAAQTSVVTIRNMVRGVKNSLRCSNV